jgi:hypothetical protein
VKPDFHQFRFGGCLVTDKVRCVSCDKDRYGAEEQGSGRSEGDGNCWVRASQNRARWAALEVMFGLVWSGRSGLDGDGEVFGFKSTRPKSEKIEEQSAAPHRGAGECCGVDTHSLTHSSSRPLFTRKPPRPAPAPAPRPRPRPTAAPQSVSLALLGAGDSWWSGSPPGPQPGFLDLRRPLQIVLMHQLTHHGCRLSSHAPGREGRKRT